MKMGKGEQADMWDYWRDKYGVEEALESYFPETLKENSMLAQALFQLKSAEVFINAFFEQAEKLEEEKTYATE